MLLIIVTWNHRPYSARPSGRAKSRTWKKIIPFTKDDVEVLVVLVAFEGKYRWSDSSRPSSRLFAVPTGRQRIRRFL